MAEDIEPFWFFGGFFLFVCLFVTNGVMTLTSKQVLCIVWFIYFKDMRLSTE